MHDNGDGYTAEELRFFGTVVASAAHEWGNVLAVIGESSGLLGDLAGLAGQGMPLDPERLAGLAETMGRQVRRGNTLLNCLRQFAHTPDESSKSVDLSEAGVTMATLAGRLAARREVELTAMPGDPVCVIRDPYRLCRLLSLCLDYAMEAVGSGGCLAVRAVATPEGGSVAVDGLPETPPPLPEALVQAARAVQADIRLEAKGRIEAVFPAPAAG